MKATALMVEEPKIIANSIPPTNAAVSSLDGIYPPGHSFGFGPLPAANIALFGPAQGQFVLADLLGDG